MITFDTRGVRGTVTKDKSTISTLNSTQSRFTEDGYLFTAQVSHLTRVIAAKKMVAGRCIYLDIASSKTGFSRKEF